MMSTALLSFVCAREGMNAIKEISTTTIVARCMGESSVPRNSFGSSIQWRKNNVHDLGGHVVRWDVQILKCSLTQPIQPSAGGFISRKKSLNAEFLQSTV